MSKEKTKQEVTSESFVALKKESISSAMEFLQKKHNISSTDASDPYLKIKKFPVGLWGLDKALYGGIPVGKCINIWGEESSGKTTLAKRIVGRAQRTCRVCQSFMELNELNLPVKCPKCKDGGRPFYPMWVDIEHSFDPDYAETLGVITEDADNKLIVFQPESAEKAAETIDIMLQAGVDLFVLDSIGAMILESEIKKDADQSQKMAFLATMVNKIIDRIVNSMNSEFPPTSILLNQLRFAPGRYAPIPYQPGGTKIRHFPHVRIKTQRTEKSNDVFSSDNILQKSKLSMTIEKSKVGTPRTSFEYNFWHQEKLSDDPLDSKAIGDNDYENDLFSDLKTMGIVYQEKNKEVIFDEKYNTQKEIKRRIKTDPEFASKCMKEVFSKMSNIPHKKTK